jgi:hypothetical protein
MQSLITGRSPVRRQSCAIALAAAAAAFAFTSPAHADYIAGCSGSTTSLTCTFSIVAGSGQLFVDSQAADINLSSTSVLTGESESFTFGGVTSTNSSFDINSTNPVDSLGHFTVVDNLLTSPPRADTITITLTGTNLATAPNELGNTFAAHIGEGCTATACAFTHFEAPVPAPIVGAGLPGLVAACGGLIALARRRRRQFAD